MDVVLGRSTTPWREEVERSRMLEPSLRRSRSATGCSVYGSKGSNPFVSGVSAKLEIAARSLCPLGTREDSFLLK